ncbi:MAG: glycosyltransferase family 4 protein [Ardenticatenaceae bacterium]|nr:glycosyltransferase family 4 protein [Ardenticatenaceae bacterium]
MRIGIDCRLPFYQMGGISQYVLHLLPALAALDGGNEYRVLHSWKDGRSHTPSAPNFQRYNLYTPCHHRLERWTLAAELLPQGLDVLHSPDFIPPAWGAKRRIVTVHDLNFHYYPQFLTADSMRYYAGQIGWAVRVADHISADSEATRQDLIEILGVAPEKVTTIHLAANPLYERVYGETAVAATLQKHNLPRGFVLFVGTLEPRKNLPMLLRAYKMMREETAVDVPLILVGSKGWIYEEIFAVIEALGLREQVRHLQGIFDEELAHLYTAAGVLVTPSFYEGFGLPALEAMHCGCPVIVSNRGSLPEVAGRAGLLLDAEDEVAWAENMARVLLSSAVREEMVANGRVQAQKFSWRETAVATLKLYQS